MTPTLIGSAALRRTARRLAALVAPVLLAVAPLAAQERTGTVAGRVTDGLSERPVAGARVAVEGGSAAAVTGPDGEYTLPEVAVGRRTLVVRAEGYERAVADVEVVVGTAPVRRDVPLTRVTFVLDRVVVTGTATPTRLRAVPNAVQVVTARQIEERGITRLEELFRGEVPGLFAAADPLGGQGGSIQVRLYSRGASNLTGGAAPPKIYLDNVLVTDPTQMATLDPQSIERVEFVPGPQASTIYGSGAINGVLQIFLKKGSHALARPRVTATASSGTVQNSFDSRVVGQQEHRVEVQGASGTTSYSLGASYLGVGEWLPGRTEERVGVSGGIRMALGRLTGEVTGRYGWFAFDGYSRPYEAKLIREGHIALGAPTDLLGIEAYRRRAQQTVALNLAYTPASWWSHHLTVGRDDRRGTTVNPPTFHTFADTLVQLGDDFATTTTVSWRTVAELPVTGSVRPTFTLGADHTGASGVSTSSSGMEETGFYSGSGSSSFRFEDPTRGYFAQAQVGVWDRVFLTAGVRVEDNPNFGEEYGLNYAPRWGASVVHPLGPVTVKVRGAYGRAINAPPPGARKDRYTTNFLGIHYRSQEGNPEIGPEAQRGGELGLDLEVGTRATLQATVFRQIADDLIGSVFTTVVDSAVLVFGFPFTYTRTQLVNLGRVRNTGVELQGTAGLGPFSVRGAFSTVESEVLRIINPRDARYRVGDALFGPARRSGSLGLLYDRGPVRVGGQLSYVGPVRLGSNGVLERERTAGRLDRLSPRTWLALPYATSAYEAGGYGLLDLNAAYDVRSTAVAFVNVSNALDRYRTDVTNIAIVPGRRMLAGLRVTF